MKVKIGFLALVILLFSCQEQEKKLTFAKPYTQRDSVYISKYQIYSKAAFNCIVDSFPNLYQYPPLHLDSAYSIKCCMESRGSAGQKQMVGFDISAYNNEFYDLYDGFLRQKNKNLMAERRQLQQNFEALVQIYEMIEALRQTKTLLIKGKIPALVEYGSYLLKAEKQSDLKDFENRKDAYLAHLKALKNEIPTDNVFPEMQNKRFIRLFYDINIQSDFDIEHCKAFEKLYKKQAIY